MVYNYTTQILLNIYYQVSLTYIEKDINIFIVNINSNYNKLFQQNEISIKNRDNEKTERSKGRKDE